MLLDLLFLAKERIHYCETCPCPVEKSVTIFSWKKYGVCSASKIISRIEMSTVINNIHGLRIPSAVRLKRVVSLIARICFVWLEKVTHPFLSWE